MSMAPIYSEIQETINSGSVFSLPRATLEKYTAALSQAHAYSHFGASEFPGTCETVRMALSIRVSEDANQLATKQSRIALFISVGALLFGLVSAAATLWPLMHPSAVQVYATTSNPVHTEPSHPPPATESSAAPPIPAAASQPLPANKHSRP